jgi:hypothetical protein
MNCYKAAKRTMADMMKDALKFYEQQLELISLLLRVHYPHIKVYYRTASPQVYKWVPSLTALEQLPSPVSKNDCVTGGNEKYQYNWGCWDVMNNIAVKAFTKHGHGVLDSGPAMTLRVDAHPCSYPYNYSLSVPKAQVDCNHFCMPPGPPTNIFDAIETEVFAREEER